MSKSDTRTSGVSFYVFRSKGAKSRSSPAKDVNNAYVHTLGLIGINARGLVGWRAADTVLVFITSHLQLLMHGHRLRASRVFRVYLFVARVTIDDRPVVKSEPG